MRVILVEFNELTPHLMESFIASGYLPNFEKLRSESTCFLTDAGEDPPNLEPWIQWVTVHTGVPFEAHAVFNLGDNARNEYPSLWDIVSAHGKSSWVCGSMNCNYRPDVRGTVLPDPWSVHVRPNDREYNDYFDFVRAHVLEYTRDRVPLSRAAYLRFLRFLMTHGATFSTTLAAATQIFVERFSDARWKRATILDRMQYDVFSHYFRRHRPDLSTFFLNSTAHFQHVYWRNMQPEAFEIRPTESQQAVYKDAVRFGYQRMDALLGKILSLAGSETAIVFATALSQQPCLKYESRGGKRLHKPKDQRQLLQFAGIDPDSCTFEPVMSEEFHLRFSDSEEADLAQQRLLSLRLGSEPMMKARRDGNSLMVGCAVYRSVGTRDMAVGPRGPARFHELFYEIDTMKSGMHHRDGMLWIRVSGGRPAAQVDKVPLEVVAPTVLSLMGIQAPDYMPAAVMGGTVGSTVRPLAEPSLAEG